MKAKTIRPLLLLLLFGFFPTSGWMIVRSGPDTTAVPAASNALPAGAPVRPQVGLPGPALPTPPGASAPSAGASNGQRSASNAPGAGSTAPGGASVSPTAPADPSGATDSAGDPAMGLGDYAFSSSDGFGDFGIPGTLPGSSASDPGSAYGGVPRGTFPSTHSGSDTGGSGTRGGSGDPGHPGGTSGNGSGGLLDPPGATGGAGGSGSTGSNPISGSNTHQATVPEPSTWALLGAGLAALILRLRRSRRTR